MKMNNRSRYTRIFYSSKVTNIQFFQINLHRFKKSHPIFTANRSGVLRESNFHPVFTRYPSSCSRSRVTGTGQCIVDVHTKKTTGAFFFTRFLSPHFFSHHYLFIYLFFLSLSTNIWIQTLTETGSWVSKPRVRILARSSFKETSGHSRVCSCIRICITNR